LREIGYRIVLKPNCVVVLGLYFLTNRGQLMNQTNQNRWLLIGSCLLLAFGCQVKKPDAPKSPCSDEGCEPQEECLMENADAEDCKVEPVQETEESSEEHAKAPSSTPEAPTQEHATAPASALEADETAFVPSLIEEVMGLPSLEEAQEQVLLEMAQEEIDAVVISELVPMAE
jgi:hypothetical protein